MTSLSLARIVPPLHGIMHFRADSKDQDMDIELSALDEMVESHASSMLFSAAEVIHPPVRQFTCALQLTVAGHASFDEQSHGAQGDVRSTTICEQVRCRIEVGDVEGATQCLRTHCPAAIQVSWQHACIDKACMCSMLNAPNNPCSMTFLMYLVPAPCSVQQGLFTHLAGC